MEEVNKTIEIIDNENSIEEIKRANLIERLTKNPNIKLNSSSSDDDFLVRKNLMKKGVTINLSKYNPKGEIFNTEKPKSNLKSTPLRNNKT